jgi:hypothetical protein
MAVHTVHAVPSPPNTRRCQRLPCATALSTALLAGCCLAWGAAQAAEGLAMPQASQIWPQWAAQKALEQPSAQRFSLLERPEFSAGLLGNHYFNTPGLRLPAAWGATSGLRATSGLLTARRPQAGGGLGAEALPYLGLGYTGLALNGGWGFSADLGVALNEGATNLGRAVFGNNSLDSAMRELRFSPVLQLGVRYAF